jgi:hypothetical protein
MSKTTQIKTNKRAINSAISKFTGAYEASGKAALSIDATAKELGAALDNNGLAMLVTVSAKPDAKYDNWFKTWGAVFGNDANVVQKTYDACREVIDALREKHTKLLKAGLTTESFNTMLQRVRKHMFLSKTDKNKSKDAKKRATTKTNKSLFMKVQKVRNAKPSGGNGGTPKVTDSTFDAKCDALAKKLEVVQKAFAPINAYITDTQDERAIIKASSNITASISELIESLETIKGAK